MLDGPEVPVDDPVLVGVVDPVGDLPDVVHGLLAVEDLFLLEDPFERPPLDVFHDHEEDVLLLLGRDHPDDVGVVEGGLEPGLLEQLVELDGLLVGDLEGDLDVEPGVLGQEDRPEPPAPEGAMISYLPTFCPCRNMLSAPEMGDHPDGRDRRGLRPEDGPSQADGLEAVRP